MTLPQTEFAVTSSCVKPWGNRLATVGAICFSTFTCRLCNNHMESHMDSCSEPFWIGFRIWGFYLHKYRWYYDTMTVSKSIEKTVFSPSSLVLPSIARFEICFLNWSIVDLQWCVSFRCTSKVTQFYIYIYVYILLQIQLYIHIYTLSRFFSIIGCYEIFNIVPCAIQ